MATCVYVGSKEWKKKKSSRLGQSIPSQLLRRARKSNGISLRASFLNASNDQEQNTNEPKPPSRPALGTDTRGFMTLSVAHLGKITELLGEWEEIEMEDKTIDEVSMGAIVQFRASLTVMDRTGAPGDAWLLAAFNVCEVMLHLPNSKGEIPINVLTGQIHDISKFMHFHFWQEVFVDIPNKKGEQLARWCYPARDVGDELTYWVLLNDTRQLVARSNVSSLIDHGFLNSLDRIILPFALF